MQTKGRMARQSKQKLTGGWKISDLTPQKMNTFYQENVLPILKDENARREYINNVLPVSFYSILENSLWPAKE